MPSPLTSPGTYDEWTTWTAQEPGVWAIPSLAAGKVEVQEEMKIVELIDFESETGDDGGNQSASSTESIALKKVVGSGRPGRQVRPTRDMTIVKPVHHVNYNPGPICRDFARHSSCPRGYVCKFQHLTRSELARLDIDLNTAMKETSPFNNYPPDVQAKIKKDLIKTKLCKDFLRGQCQRDGRCYFAHIAGHDAHKVLDILNKSKPCPWLKHTDACKSGRSCPFNHSRAYKRLVIQKRDGRQAYNKLEHQASGVVAKAGRNIPEAGKPASVYYDSAELLEKVIAESSSSSSSGKESDDSINAEKAGNRDLVTEYLARLSV